MKVHELSPILWTKSIAETRTFYENVLGFSGQSNFPNFISLSKDDSRIMFVVPSYDPEEKEDPTRENDFFSKPILTGSIYMFVENVDDFWEKIKNQARIKSPIANREYLMRDFAIIDNNGYELVFGQDISNPE